MLSGKIPLWSLMAVKRFATVPNQMADKVKLLFNCIYFYHHDSNLVWFDVIISVIKSPDEVLVNLGWISNSVTHNLTNYFHFVHLTYSAFNSQDLMVNSLFQLLHISLKVSFENLVIDQDKKLYLLSLSILITCLLDNVWILKGEVTC